MGPHDRTSPYQPPHGTAPGFAPHAQTLPLDGAARVDPATLPALRVDPKASAWDIARDLVRAALLAHPLPWRIEDGWTCEVTAADGAVIAKCATFARAQAIVAVAEGIQAELDAARMENP